jgi:hypothetical protein
MENCKFSEYSFGKHYQKKQELWVELRLLSVQLLSKIMESKIMESKSAFQVNAFRKNGKQEDGKQKRNCSGAEIFQRTGNLSA